MSLWMRWNLTDSVCLLYSPEEDTAAARMEGQIEEEVKEERQAETDGTAAGNCV